MEKIALAVRKVDEGYPRIVAFNTWEAAENFIAMAPGFNEGEWTLHEQQVFTMDDVLTYQRLDILANH